MSDMSIIETRERFSKSLLKAASNARELARIQKNNSWLQVAINLDQMREQGEKMYKSGGIGRQESLAIAERIAKNVTVN